MKIYFIVSRFPYPLIKGDKLRAFHQIRELSASHEIYLAALSDVPVPEDALNALRPYCKEIKVYRLRKPVILMNLIFNFIFTRNPLQVGYFFSRSIRDKMHAEISRIKPDRIFCQLIRTAEYALGVKNIPRTLDYMDALSAGMERREEQAPYLLKPIFRMEARRLKRYEHQIFNEFENCCIISKSDRDLIFHFENEDIGIVPNGIDSDYFKPREEVKEFDLLFTGNMSYPPNVSTARYLVEEILPAVRAIHPTVRLLISGANPSSVVRGLQSEYVTVRGWVDDIRNSYASCHIFIAPMLIGSGLQNKLLEAMSMKLPCITSELANRSLGAEEGQQILVGRHTVEYVSLIADLLSNAKKAGEIAEKGHSFVVENYNWSRSNGILTEMLQDGIVAKDH